LSERAIWQRSSMAVTVVGSSSPSRPVTNSVESVIGMRISTNVRHDRQLRRWIVHTPRCALYGAPLSAARPHPAPHPGSARPGIAVHRNGERIQALPRKICPVADLHTVQVVGSIPTTPTKFDQRFRYLRSTVAKSVASSRSFPSRIATLSL